MMFHPRLIALATTCAVLMPACATAVLPQQQLADTQAAIASTETLGGASDPDAKLHLQYAREQMERAKRMMAEGDDDEALRMLDRASADAELALALAKTEQMRKRSEEAKAELDKLKSEGQARNDVRNETEGGSGGAAASPSAVQ